MKWNFTYVACQAGGRLPSGYARLRHRGERGREHLHRVLDPRPLRHVQAVDGLRPDGQGDVDPAVDPLEVQLVAVVVLRLGLAPHAAVGKLHLLRARLVRVLDDLEEGDEVLAAVGQDASVAVLGEQRRVQVPDQEECGHALLAGLEHEVEVPKVDVLPQHPLDRVEDQARCDARRLRLDLVQVRDAPPAVADALAVFRVDGGSMALLATDVSDYCCPYKRVPLLPYPPCQ